jgi:hypothetical protein
MSTEPLAAEPHTDEAFWGTPLEAAPRLLDELLGAHHRGMRLWAPASVSLDTRSSLPVEVGVVGPSHELDRLAFVERSIVVAVDLATGAASAVRTAGTGGPARLVPPPGFEGGLGRASGAQAARVARVRLWEGSDGSTAWTPGRYRLTALAADWISNDLVVEVARSSSTIDPAVQEARAASPLQAWPPPDPAGGLPRYDSRGWSVATPAVAGVSLRAERIVRVGESATLEGAVRALPLASGPVVPVTLVVTGTETVGPWLVPMRVPSFDGAGSRSVGEITAHFAVDLLRLAPLAASPQTYFVYAFTADGRGGPEPVAVVAA